MRYKLQNSSGHAGEFYICYRITSDLKCPARLLTSDLGIDGEYELIEKGSDISKSKIVRFQVKSQKSIIRNKKSFLVDNQHRIYWDNFIEPIIFFLFTTNDIKLYFKLLTPFSFKEKDSKLYVEFTTADEYSPERLRLVTKKYENSNFNLLDRIINLRREINNARKMSAFEQATLLKEKVNSLEIVANEIYWGKKQEIEDQINSLNQALNKLDMDSDIDAMGRYY